MTREGLLTALRQLKSDTDYEEAHVLADDALLEFINDPEITRAFGDIEKCYA